MQKNSKLPSKEEKANLIKDITVWWNKIGIGGCWIYSAWHPDWIGPIGFVAGLAGGDIFQVSQSFVDRRVRRFGIRTKINETIHQHFKVIQTWGGSETGGKAFMDASGYKYDPVRNDYILVRPKEKTKSARNKVSQKKEKSKYRRSGKKRRRR